MIPATYHNVLYKLIYRLRVRDQSRTGHRRKRREHLRNISPPLLTVPLVPIHRDCQAFHEARSLVPAELAQLRPVHCVPLVVERSVSRVLHPPV